MLQILTPKFTVTVSIYLELSFNGVGILGNHL